MPTDFQAAAKRTYDDAEKLHEHQRLGDSDHLADPVLLSKLSRVYVDIPKQEAPTTFADRVGILVDQLERTYEPTIVLIDSRSGIHDLAAITTTRLGATTFLFAVASRQTWDAYEILLSGWARQPGVAHEIRERLLVVAAQIPETGRKKHRKRAQQDAYRSRPPLGASGDGRCSRISSYRAPKPRS